MKDVEHENITVTELPDGADGAVLGSVLGVYEQHGFDAGYRRAVRDVSLSLLELTEDVVQRRSLSASDAGNLRRAAWALHEQLQCRGQREAADEGFVEGGLGI